MLPVINYILSLLTELLRLAGNQLRIVEIVDLHRIAHVMQRLCRNLARLCAAFLQDFINRRDILLQLLAALTDRLQLLLQDIVQELLDLDIAEAAALVMCLELVEICILRPVALKVLRLAERIQIGEDGVAFMLP